jgi:hypothetical protein
MILNNSTNLQSSPRATSACREATAAELTKGVVVKRNSEKKHGAKGKTAVETPRVWLAIDRLDGTRMGYFVYRDKKPIAFVLLANFTGFMLARSIAFARGVSFEVGDRSSVVDDLRSLRLDGHHVNVPGYLSVAILLPVTRVGKVCRLPGYDHAGFDTSKLMSVPGRPSQARLYKAKWDADFLPAGLKIFRKQKSGQSRGPSIAKLASGRDARPVTRMAA